LQSFYAPARGLREVRDRGSLASTGFVALFVNGAFFLCVTLFYIRHLLDASSLGKIFSLLIQSGSFLVLLAVFFSPATLFLTNVLDRRGSFRLLFQQEYSTLTSVLFYGLSSASLIATLITIAGKISGVQETLATRMLNVLLARGPLPPAFGTELITPGLIAAGLSVLILFFVFGVWAMLAIRVVLRLSWWRSLFVVGISGVLLLAGFRVLPILSAILASPFLLLMLFLLLRGVVADVTRTHRARESFKHNLEAATVNPADSSAHYNLGLIHQQRGEFDEARERFERAVQIDEDEIDAHYQLGRIARQQKRWADAIRHFEQVVSRDQSHAQYEIWREVGATYVSAGQYADAITALEPFIERRPSDPEALYLMGRAHAGLGHQREAKSLMQACIDAVKTAPAYKYRSDKRWLNEAQQFIKSVQ
jgi:tetratricopeptide (TPR) repeat protein